MNIHKKTILPPKGMSETALTEYLCMPCHAWYNLITSIIIVLDVILLTFSLSGSG